MSKKKTADFIVGNALQEMCCFGESRHEAKLKAKAEGKDRIEGIFSYETYHYYRNIGRRFYEWARIRDPRIRGIPDAAKYVGEYVKYRIDSNLSAWTISSEASALCKLCRATRE